MSRRRRTRSAVAIALIAVGVLAAACSDEPERSVANYCSQVHTITTLDADLATGDPVRIQARADDLRLLQQVAPVEIEPSIGVLLTITDDFARTAGTATDRAEVADEVFRGRSGDITAIEAAGDEVARYTATTCQVDLDGAGSTSVPGSSTASTAPGPTGDPITTTTTTRTTSTGGGPASTTTTTPSLLVD